MNVLLAVVISSAGQAQTNIWANTAGGKWETGANWSRGTAPSIADTADFVTNANSQTITIDATTSGGFPSTMTISNLTMSGPLGSTNTLFLNNAGTNTPLHVLGSALTLDRNGVMVVNNSAVLATDGNGVHVGDVGGNAAMTISNGGGLYSGIDSIGNNSNSIGNSVLIAGRGTIWSNTTLYVGHFGAGNSLTVSNGGAVWNGAITDLGDQSSSSNNTAVIRDPGSVWSNNFDLYIGNLGSGNSLTITNGGAVVTARFGAVGWSPFNSNNVVTVSGNGATWQIAGFLRVGFPGTSDQLVIGAGGTVIASNAVIGLDNISLASGNVLQVNGGSLFVTNSSGNGLLAVGQSSGTGSLILNGGSVTVNQLELVNGISSVFDFNAGTLNSGASFVNNNQLFVVGDGTDAATFHLSGGVHSFANNLEVRNNASLTGCGTINGNITIDSGSSVQADCGGTLTFTGIVTNNGTMQAINSSVLEAYGTMVNNGTINIANGLTNFHGAFINNGTVLGTNGTVLGPSSSLASNSWISAAGGNWEGTANWSAGNAPSSTYSEIIISNSSSTTVTISSNTANNFTSTMIISNLTVSALGGVTNTLVLNTAGSPTPLEILNGIGLNSGGLMEVDNTSLLIDSYANGGFLIAGTVIVQNGGQITAACQQMTVSNGTLLANELNVGLDCGSQGTLTVAGGTITLSSLLDIGVSAAATGTVWLLGGQLWVTNGCTSIGDSGVGCLTVSNGTFLASGVGVGLSSGSQGTLLVAGGSLSVLSNMVVGNTTCSSLGTITMSGGTLFVTNAATMAVLELRNGTFTLNGGWLVVDQLVITNACAGFIQNGGTLTVGNLVLDPNMSAVGDGIPNGWKQQYGLDPFDPNLSNEDADGTGMSNLQKYLAGIDPTNSASSFRITSLVVTSDDVLVTWTMGSGKTNALQATTGDPSCGYTDIFTASNTVGTVTNYLDTGAATNSPSRYYRVRLVP
jgi:T5SS/PEP-CTERM-associated repeat protein